MALHSVRYFKSRLFIDGHNCKFNKNNVCRCSTPGCPYRVEVATLGSAHGKKRVASVVRVTFPRHWHGGPQERMKERRKRIVHEKAHNARNGECWEVLKEQHDAMQRQVERESAEKMSHLREKLAVEASPSNISACRARRSRTGRRQRAPPRRSSSSPSFLKSSNLPLFAFSLFVIDSFLHLFASLYSNSKQ